MFGELADVTRGVRDEADLQAHAPQLVEHRHHVFVQLEVLVTASSGR